MQTRETSGCDTRSKSGRTSFLTVLQVSGRFTIDVRGVVKLGFHATDQRVLCALRVYFVRIDH